MAVDYTKSSYYLARELERAGAIAGFSLGSDPFFPVVEMYNHDQNRMISITTELDDKGLEHMIYTVYDASDRDLQDPLTMGGSLFKDAYRKLLTVV